MSCCVPTIFDFVNEASTTVPFTPSMKEQYGSHPKVQVAYLDTETGEYVLSGFFTRVAFTGSTVVIEHGGIQSGVITIT